jgi:Protein of unknown function (DUF1214)
VSARRKWVDVGNGVRMREQTKTAVAFHRCGLARPCRIAALARLAPRRACRAQYSDARHRRSDPCGSAGLKRKADGSLTLYAGTASPSKERESNWLAAPTATSRSTSEPIGETADPRWFLAAGEDCESQIRPGVAIGHRPSSTISFGRADALLPDVRAHRQFLTWTRRLRRRQARRRGCMSATPPMVAG